MSKLAQMAVEETYLDVQKLLHQVVWSFQKKHGGNHDELMCVAHEKFMVAYHSKKRYTRLSTWLVNMVWWGLLDYNRQEATQHARFTAVSGMENNPLACLPAIIRFDVQQFLGNLTDDARFVALLALESPPDIMLEARRLHPTAKEPCKRQAIIEFLSDIGWAVERIAESFAEVRSALLD